MRNKQALVFSFLGILWILYLGLRAFYVPFTFDESATFFHFVHTGDFWFFTSLPDAGNHFINTLLTYISYSLFGSSKFALRLPNLLLTIVFLYYLFRISLFLNNKSIRWIFILSLMFSHYFIEFLAVSRGYGMSMAFLFGAFYYLMKFSSDFSIKHLLSLSLFLLLALFSNFSILVLSMAIIVYQFILLIFTKKASAKYGIYRLSVLILLQVLPLAFAAYYMFYLHGKGSLYYGNTDGFWALTTMSLILFLTGTKMMVFQVAVLVYILGMLCGTTLLIWREKPTVLLQPKLVFPLLLFSTIIGLLLITALFSVNNPEDRVAMYLIPLFIGSISMITDTLVVSTGKKWLTLLLIPLLFLPVHFFSVINLHYVNGYITEVIPERFYETIANDTDNQVAYPATIGGYRMRMFCWTYMNFRNGGTQNLIDYKAYPDMQSDYQVVDVDEYPGWLINYDVIATEDIMGRKLLKRKQQIEYELVIRNTINPISEMNKEFYSLANWDADTLKGYSYLVGINMAIHSSEIPFHAWVVMQINDKNGKTLQYKNIPFDWLKTRWYKDGNRLKNSLLTGTLPPETGLIKVYIWNINKGIFTIEEGQIDLFRVKESGLE